MKIKTSIQTGILLIILGSILILVAGCGAGNKALPPADEGQAMQLDAEDEAQAYYHFTNANIIEMLGATQQALDEYEKALLYNPESVTIRTDYARLLFRMHRISESLAQALLIEPKSAEVCLLIGDCYRLSDKDPEAIVYYKKAVELDPDNINAYWYLAGYYQSSDDLDSAIWAYYELARLSDTYRIWLELGLLLGRDQRYTEAKDAFIRSLEINSDQANINSYLGLATTYDALDSLDLADKYLWEAASLDSNNVRIFRQMLNMYRLRNDTKKSLKASGRLIALVPSDWEAQRYHGFLLYVDGQLDAADSLFRNRIDFGDDHPLNFFYLGRIAVEKEDMEEGRTNFTRCVTRDSTFVDGWLNLAFTWRQEDSLDQAIDVYQRGLEYIERPEDRARLLFALGATQERNNQFHEAVTTFQDLISLDPNFDQALNYLGYMLADSGQQLQYALELIERAMELSPNNGAYLDSYGWVQFRLGNYEMALSELEKAAGLINNDPIIFEHMGDVLKKMGKTSEAERSYRQALEIAPDSLNIEEKMK